MAAETRFIAAQNWNHFLYFALIGLILFLAPVIGTFSEKTLTGYVLATLYLMGPLAGVLSSFSLFGRAEVAFQKVEKLGISLSEHSTEVCSIDDTDAELSFEKLELDRVVHSYHGVEHRTLADPEAEVILFEPAQTRNTGNVIDDTFTAPNGVVV